MQIAYVQKKKKRFSIVWMNLIIAVAGKCMIHYEVNCWWIWYNWTWKWRKYNHVEKVEYNWHDNKYCKYMPVDIVCMADVMWTSICHLLAMGNRHAYALCTWHRQINPPLNIILICGVWSKDCNVEKQKWKFMMKWELERDNV